MTHTEISNDAQMAKYIMKALELNVDETVKRVTDKYKKMAHKEIAEEINKEKVKIALSISQMFDVEFSQNKVVIHMKIHNENIKEIR